MRKIDFGAMRSLKGTRRLFSILLVLFAAVISTASWSISLVVSKIPALEENDIPGIVIMLIISIALSFAATLVLARLFLLPINRLAEGMDKVSKGDFSVKIERRSTLADMNRLYDNFNTMTDELSSTEILQTDFAANVSHEFKTPINAIEGYATLLQSYEDIPEEMQEYVDKILFNTGRLSSLVGDILLLNKVDNRTITGTLAHYMLDEQIRLCLMQFETAWEKKELELDVDLDEVEYFGNRNLMSHVWTNLISNAVKFSPNGGLLRLRLSSNGTVAIFTIDDNGPGISPETALHMFDKFYQGDTSHKSEGNGLGLALVQRILKSCGGDVKAENLSDGSRFTVTLPLN